MRVAIVMPAFNEADGISEFLAELAAAFADLPTCFVVVDDASSDETAAAVRAAAAGMELRLHHNEVRSGHGLSTLTALRQGLETGASIVVAVDGDGQFHGHDVRAVFDRLVADESLGVVEGVRQHTRGRAYRRLVSWATRLLVLGRCGSAPGDANTPLRAYRRDFLQWLLARVPTSSAVPNLFISVLTRRSTRPHAEVAVESLPGRGAQPVSSSWGKGRSFLPPRRFLTFCLRATREWLTTPIRADSAAAAPRPSRRTAKALTALFVVASAVFGCSRTAAAGPDDVTDLAVWVPVHEWMARGSTLYASVWDHKDWGFFWFTQPFYAALQVTGLYLAALVSLLMFAVGTYLLVERYVRKTRAAALAALGVVAYAGYPDYLATHTENMSVGPLVLGLGLLRRRPVLAGVLLAMSAAVKITGLVLAVVVLAFLLVSARTARRRGDTPVRRQPAGRFAAGFIGATSVFVAIAAAQGSWAGWLDVIRYNREYQAYRGFPPDVSTWQELPFALLRNAVIDIGLLEDKDLWALSLLVCAGTIGAVSTFRLARAGLPLPPTLTRELMGLVGVAALAGGAVISQRPIAHHWVYAVGPLLAATLLATAGLLIGWDAGVAGERLSARAGATAVCILALLVAAAAPQVVRREAVTDLANWTSLDSGGYLTGELGAFGEPVSVATFGANNHRVDVAALPAGSRLACRFVYQFPHMIPRYGDEMSECLGKRPDVVLTEISPFWGDPQLQEEVRAVLAEAYVRCAAPGQPYEVWARRTMGCP